MRYKITVEEILADNNISEEKLEFEAESHENILAIVEKLKQHPDFDNNDAAILGVGLKLFTAGMLKQKDNSLFENLMPPFKDFMKRLKSSGKEK